MGGSAFLEALLKLRVKNCERSRSGTPSASARFRHGHWFLTASCQLAVITTSMGLHCTSSCNCIHNGSLFELLGTRPSLTQISLARLTTSRLFFGIEHVTLAFQSFNGAQARFKIHCICIAQTTNDSVSSVVRPARRVGGSTRGIRPDSTHTTRWFTRLTPPL